MSTRFFLENCRSPFCQYLLSLSYSSIMCLEVAELGNEASASGSIHKQPTAEESYSSAEGESIRKGVRKLRLIQIFAKPTCGVQLPP